MKENRKFFLGMLFGFLLAAIIAGGIFTARKVIGLFRAPEVGSVSDENDPVVNTYTMQKLALLKDMIEKNYALELPGDSAMEEGIYQGLVTSLGDPYSHYFSAEEMAEQKQKMDGTYYGIGCYVSYDEQVNFARLGEIFPNSPAQEAGLKKGDWIIRVDGKYTRNRSLEDTVALIKGASGTTVDLTIMREGIEDFIEVEVERREVPTQTISYEKKDDGIAYIRIKEFDAVTIDQFAEALAEANADEMKGLVLDLRDNPGGNLNAVLEVARRILPKGLIVYTEDKDGTRMDYTCDGEHELKVPLAVLVNGQSASSSEILAGAIKDFGKGRLIGTKTFGKGIVQKYLSISDGSTLKTTTSKYYTPNGNNIHGIGIEPDETLELDYESYYTKGEDNQLERACQYLKTEIQTQAKQ